MNVLNQDIFPIHPTNQINKIHYFVYHINQIIVLSQIVLISKHIHHTNIVHFMNAKHYNVQTKFVAKRNKDVTNVYQRTKRKI